MSAKDDLDPAEALPRFLVAQTERDIDVAADEAVTPSRASKVRVLILTAAAAGIAVLAIGNPMGLVAEVSVLLAGNPPLQPASIQSAADAPVLIAAAAADAQDLPQVVPPASDGGTARAEIAVEPPARDQTEKTEPPSETLFKQFQAWAATQQEQKPVAAVEPAQDAPASIMREVQTPVTKRARVRYRHVQKRESVRATIRNARAEVRSQNVRRLTPQEQAARAARPPAQDPRAQDAAAQEAQPAPFLGVFGQRN